MTNAQDTGNEVGAARAAANERAVIARVLIDAGFLDARDPNTRTTTDALRAAVRDTAGDPAAVARVLEAEHIGDEGDPYTDEVAARIVKALRGKGPRR